jgi:RNA polymerase sigma factor (sigma-70 family)
LATVSDAPVDSGVALLAAVQGGDQGALAQLYDQYSDALFGTILKIVGTRDQAEEVLQDTFVKIWRSAATYDPSKGRTFTWMLNIARNTAIDLVRTTQFRSAQQIQGIDKHVHRLGSDEERSRSENLGMDTVLSRLKPEHRELIDMAYYQGYSQQEIADRTGLALGTVKSRTRAALQQLREALMDHA